TAVATTRSERIPRDDFQERKNSAAATRKRSRTRNEKKDPTVSRCPAHTTSATRSTKHTGRTSAPPGTASAKRTFTASTVAATSTGVHQESVSRRVNRSPRNSGLAGLRSGSADHARCADSGAERAGATGRSAGTKSTAIGGTGDHRGQNSRVGRPAAARKAPRTMY